MQFKKYTKQRNSIQGLRSFKDTLPKNIKKVINKRGHIYSETINNWKYIVGENLFKVCYPKSFKTSNKVGVSTLLINVKRGHEVELEYSRKNILDKLNNLFGYSVVEKIKLASFNDEKIEPSTNDKNSYNVTNHDYQKKINSVKNEKIKKSIFGISSRASDYAQALMELGAMICKPKNPECSACPILKSCKSYKKKDFDLAKIRKKNKEKYFILKVYKKNQKYLLVKNTKFNFLKNLAIFPMEELSKPKNFNENFNFKMSNMNMNIKIQYLKNLKKFPSSYWFDKRRLDNYMLPTFTKKVVKYLEKN